MKDELKNTINTDTCEKENSEDGNKMEAADSFARMRQNRSKSFDLPEEIGTLTENHEKEYIAPPGWDDDEDDFMAAKSDAPQTEEEKEKTRQLLAESRHLAANVGNFGLFLILAVGVGYLIGSFLDDWLGIKPVMTVFWIVCGVASALMELVKNIKAAAKLAESEGADKEHQVKEKAMLLLNAAEHTSEPKSHAKPVKKTGE